MTAIVGIINRQGIALAADSAATLTISDKRKITNHTNKIFALSKKQPVGIAVYNNLAFHGVPWEVIIKTYRDNHLKDQEYPKLSDYVNDFWTFLTSSILPKLDDSQKSHVIILARGLLAESKETAINNLDKQGTPVNSTPLLAEIKKFLKQILGKFSAISKCDGFEGYTKEMLRQYGEKEIETVIKSILPDMAYSQDFLDLFIATLHSIIISSTNIYLSYTGLVFFGYGGADLFPSYFEYRVGAAFDNRVKHFHIADYVVSNINNACVAPFAQSDVANTVVRGIDQKLRDTITNELQKHFETFRNTISETLGKASAPQSLLDGINGLKINDMVAPFVEDLDKYIRENYTDKLLGTVAMLSKEDLADMAESLVKMTCLKRHVTTDDETVGGPVDVAVITKGDGFIWIKRKHYFDPSLNHHYFEK